MNAVRVMWVVLGFFGAGCHQLVELDPYVDAMIEGPSDGSSGCDGGPCAPHRCVPTGQTCVAAAECCSLSCGEDGVCLAAAACAPVGESCSRGAECCGGACASDEVGGRTCQALGGCLVSGEVCSRDGDCCSGALGACELVDPVSGLGRCVDIGACGMAGDVCGLSGSPGSARECCPGGVAARGLCRPTSVGAAQRCVSQQAGMACLVDGEPCALPDECCGGSCVPEGTALRCGSGCRPEHARCTRSADCCDGMCEDGVCRGTARVCVPLGSGCETAMDCCSETCVGGTCAAELF